MMTEKELGVIAKMNGYDAIVPIKGVYYFGGEIKMGRWVMDRRAIRVDEEIPETGTGKWSPKFSSQYKYMAISSDYKGDYRKENYLREEDLRQLADVAIDKAYQDMSNSEKDRFEQMEAQITEDVAPEVFFQVFGENTDDWAADIEGYEGDYRVRNFYDTLDSRVYEEIINRGIVVDEKSV